MGGPGSGSVNYRLPLSLTKEMRIALIKGMAAESTSDDFPIALRIFRAGEILYGLMGQPELASMYNRKNDKGEPLINDAEIDFLVKKELIEDFRVKTITKEEIGKLNKLKEIEKINAGRLELWNKTDLNQRLKWYNQAKAQADISTNAKKLIELYGPAVEEAPTTTN